ncbi:MAG: toprim domain-containing protein [Candidatus Bathyarchaeia archaeon]
MSITLRKKREKLLQLLDRLAEMSAKGIPIIVEGKRDVNALHALDVKGDIISAKTSGRRFLDVLSEVGRRGKREAILLMDFDRRGKEWTKRLAKHLEEMRIKPNLFFWKRLQGLVGRDVKDVEGLATYMKTLRKKLG